MGDINNHIYIEDYGIYDDDGRCVRYQLLRHCCGHIDALEFFYTKRELFRFLSVYSLACINITGEKLIVTNRTSLVLPKSMVFVTLAERHARRLFCLNIVWEIRSGKPTLEIRDDDDRLVGGYVGLPTPRLAMHKIRTMGLVQP